VVRHTRSWEPGLVAAGEPTPAEVRRGVRRETVMEMLVSGGIEGGGGGATAPRRGRDGHRRWEGWVSVNGVCLWTWKA
jgi:hypothetical protein